MYRSLLFIPGNNERFLVKSTSLKPDILCFDLEDSVPLNDKQVARKLVAEHLASRQEDKESSIYVRINSVDSGLVKEDLDKIIVNGLDGVVLPKINNSQEVIEIADKIEALVSKRGISARIRIIPSIETAKGVIHANSIALAHENVVALVFGVFDYLYDMNIDVEYDDGISYYYARSKIPVDAKAAGIEALDGIWQEVNDIDGLIKDATNARKLGYSGKTLIHPSHIIPVHDIFRPTKKQIEWAEKVLAALQDAFEKGNTKGAILLDGKMIDAVHYKQAKSVIKAAKQ
ncbi:MAG: CoA ester lyase [Nitrososphaeraceae archaeon]|nr:CoA ester lyase [Nitrososphaeraceae archaeon]MDW0136041.1 CoA ester lyase [Nitrososphaeraceae archaeon]MDW0154902.1 CoA ester lyase [Nitrososphaeraceae archaeon]